MWGFLNFILGLLRFIPQRPPVQERLGAAENQLASEEAARAQLEKMAAAGNAAVVAGVLRDTSADRVTTDRAAAVNADPNLHLRD
jgi:hypothetical protein